jgi:hypothetical protein
MLDVDLLNAQGSRKARARHSPNSGPLLWSINGELSMTDYRFAVIIPTEALTHDGILDATDALGSSGCTDASIRGHKDGMELLFERAADSLEAAISSAIADVERAGYSVTRVEMEREAISV